MPSKARFKKFAVNAASLAVHFAHGGLLVTGILVVVLVIGSYGGFLEPLIGTVGAQGTTGGAQDALVPQSTNVGTHSMSVPQATSVASKDAMVRQSLIAVDDVPTIEKVAVEAEGSDKPLKPKMRAVANYLARRYHVSNQAIEPLVSAAQSAGTRAKIDPLLILAVMAIESRFNPFAESVVGAQGLMQVMPKYHQDKLEAKGASKNALLMEPHMNIQVGVLILKESISRAGSLQAGLQQYAGAPDDPDARYASKVMAEKQRLEHAAQKKIAARRSHQSDSRA